VSSQELRVGLQMVSVSGVLTARVFIADALENGAGYAAYLGQPTVFTRLLEIINDDIRPKLESPPHAATCDSSCPDCLRSYENRSVHALLDWRLALDLAELAAGKPLDNGRWLQHGPRLAANFAAGFGLQSVDTGGGLPAVMDKSTGRVAYFGHPLWRSDPAFLTSEQAAAQVACGAVSQELRAWDLLTLSRRPDQVYAWIAS
jgi:DEAD/DEAH box helicase domain-containing protein